MSFSSFLSPALRVDPNAGRRLQMEGNESVNGFTVGYAVDIPVSLNDYVNMLVCFDTSFYRHLHHLAQILCSHHLCDTGSLVIKHAYI